jgi:hypothetical protein
MPKRLLAAPAPREAINYLKGLEASAPDIAAAAYTHLSAHAYSSIQHGKLAR